MEKSASITASHRARARSGWKESYYHYDMVLRPWFWLLGNKADCRIFLDKNVKDIIQEVFTKDGF